MPTVKFTGIIYIRTCNQSYTECKLLENIERNAIDRGCDGGCANSVSSKNAEFKRFVVLWYLSYAPIVYSNQVKYQLPGIPDSL